MARKQWRCFHCDEVFIRPACAAVHFGTDETRTPACQLKSHERHLVEYIRELENDLDGYRAEDSHILRSIYTLEADHRQALIRAEEEGYNKGVRDMTIQNDAREPCKYCGPGIQTELPGNACENCMNTGLKNPTAEDLK